jgi:hypothetical protein
MNIKVNKLKQGNKVLLETKESVFDFEILDPENGLIMIEGGRKFTTAKVATLVGVYGRRDFLHQDSLLAPLEIERGQGIEIQYRDSDNIYSDFVTSPVLSARIHGTDAEGKEWGFEVWDSSEQDATLAKSLAEARDRLRAQIPNTKEETDEDSM